MSVLQNTRRSRTRNPYSAKRAMDDFGEKSRGRFGEKSQGQHAQKAELPRKWCSRAGAVSVNQKLIAAGYATPIRRNAPWTILEKSPRGDLAKSPRDNSRRKWGFLESVLPRRRRERFANTRRGRTRNPYSAKRPMDDFGEKSWGRFGEKSQGQCA